MVVALLDHQKFPRSLKLVVMNRSRGSLVLIAVALAACTEASGPQLSFPDKLMRVSSETLEGEAGFAVAESLKVRVVDRNGNGIAGQSIEFRVIEGNGSVSPEITETDATGIARAQWLLGPTPGNNTVEARARGADMGTVQFRAFARSSPGDRIERVSGGGGLVIGGCPLPAPLVVRVTDNTGKPVANATVEFTADANGGVAEPNVVKTDAQGLASATWRPGTEGGNATIRAVLRTATAPSVAFNAESRPVAPNGYAVIGNQIWSSRTCAVHRFIGAARPSLQWTPGGDDRFVNVAQDFATMKTWGANTVRIPLNQSYWVQSSTRNYDPSYRPRVIDAVQKARAAGLDVILDLHVSDRGDPNYNYEFTGDDLQQMPDRAHSLPFWQDLADLYKNDGGVMFELYNEPHEVTPQMWLNGGTIPAGTRYPGDADPASYFRAYDAVGMQELYNAVRAKGARNLVIIGGLHWGYFLNQLPQYEVKGYNIAYATHPYNWPDKQPAVWEADWGSVSDRYPVVITEFGSYGCTTDTRNYLTALINYAESKKMSWIAWAWWTAPAPSSGYPESQRIADVCRFPALLDDWNGTPSFHGNVIKPRMAEAAAKIN